jgi:hypothetical protein
MNEPIYERIKLTIDTCQSDRNFVKKFEEEVRTLAGLVIEAVEENPTYLLSPLMRKMLADHAKKTKESLDQLVCKGGLSFDNPGKSL